MQTEVSSHEVSTANIIIIKCLSLIYTVKQPINNDKMILMSRIASYFLIFSRLSVSLILFLIIIMMGYALVKSYKKIDLSSENTNEQIFLLSEKIFLNNQNMADVSRRLDLKDKKINEIKEILLSTQNKLNNLNYDSKIVELLSLNKQLKNEIAEIKENITLYKNVKNKNELNLDMNDYKIKNLRSIYLITLLKFKNGKDIKDEIAIMEKLLSPQKKVIFEKLNITDFSKFNGLENLYNEFEIATNKMIKNNFLEKNQGAIIKFIFNFISISPNKLNNYESEELNILMSAKKAMEQNNIENALIQILKIKNYDKFFNEWIDQSNKYLEYILFLEKII